MGGNANTGHKYSLNFSVQALNLFNDIDYGTPGEPSDPKLQPVNEPCRRHLQRRLGGTPRLRAVVFSF